MSLQALIEEMTKQYGSSFVKMTFFMFNGEPGSMKVQREEGFLYQCMEQLDGRYWIVPEDITIKDGKTSKEPFDRENRLMLATEFNNILPSIIKVNDELIQVNVQNPQETK